MMHSPFSEAIDSACQLAREDVRKAIELPVWGALYAKNANFAAGLPAELKLALLRHVHNMLDGFGIPDSAWEQDESDQLHDVERLLDRLYSVEVELNPWKVCSQGVAYASGDASLEHDLELGDGWSAHFRFSDCDIEMSDVNYGCDESLSLGAWLRALFEAPGQDIRAFAQSEGICYEPAMSPDGGDYFRLELLRLEHASGFSVEFYPEELEDVFASDRELARILAAHSGRLPAEQTGLLLAGRSGLRPVFSAAPQVDEQTAHSSESFHWISEDAGRIKVTWRCQCWLPASGLIGDKPPRSSDVEALCFAPVAIEDVFVCHGAGCGDYKTLYSMDTVEDATDVLLKSLQSPVLNPLYLYVLGLTELPPLAAVASPPV